MVLQYQVIFSLVLLRANQYGSFDETDWLRLEDFGDPKLLEINSHHTLSLCAHFITLLHHHCNIYIYICVCV